MCINANVFDNTFNKKVNNRRFKALTVGGYPLYDRYTL